MPFEEAVTVFLDADALDGPDLHHSTREARFVLAEFRKEARRRRVGYQTLMNAALAEHIRKDVA